MDKYIISKFDKNETEFQYGRFQKRDYLGRYTKYFISENSVFQNIVSAA